MLPLRDRLPTRSRPWLTWLLVAANLAVYGWEQVSLLGGMKPESLVGTWGFVPARLSADTLGELDNVVTSMFMHDPMGLLHVGNNMLFLWIFGDNVEDALGKTRYGLFYLAAGLAAAFTQFLTNTQSVIPMVGASGAIAGVLAGYGRLFPSSPITVLNPFPPLWLFWGITFELPAWIIIAEFFVLNLWSGFSSLGSTAGGGVAFFAHLGGFVAGFFLIRAMIEQRHHRPLRDWTSSRVPPDARIRRIRRMR